MNKSARQRAPKTAAKMEVKGQGRADGSTEIATMDHRAQALELFLLDVPVGEIARRLRRDVRSVQRYVQDARCRILSQKKAYFDERLALQLDDAMDSLAVSADLLGDADFLKSAEPERIDAISRAYGILSDKCFVLLAAGRSRAVAATGPTGAETVSG